MINGYDIKMEDLPPEFRGIADEIGLSPALRLVELRGGDGIYVPKADKICRAARDRAIRSEFNGNNYRELAKKHGLTVVWIRAIVAGGQAGHKGLTGVDVIDRQQSLF